jgi:hypothetical protein
VSSMKERDIARQLAEREGLDPPAGLLERIKSEIPATIQLGAAAPGGEPRERRRAGDSRQRWLLAASLAAMVGAGFFALRLREQAPAFEAGRRAAPERPAPSHRSGPPPEEVPGSSGEEPEGALQPELRREAPAGAAPRVPPPPPPKPAPQEVPRRVAGGVAGSVRGGVAGGVVGGVPSAPAPSPPAAKAAAPQPVQASESQVEEMGHVVAESPLQDERRRAPKREGKPEYHDFDSFEETTDAKPAAPAGAKDVPVLPPEVGANPNRINVGGNESGQQGAYVGLGTRAAEDGRRLAYGPASDSGSCEHARRELAAGRLPAPGSVRVGDFLGFLDSAGAGRGRLEKTAPPPAPVKAQLLEAVGAPNPFGDARSRLLLFRLRGGAAVPAGARMEVELNPAVVARYREIGAGPGLSALYEVELRDDAASGRIASLRVRGLPALKDEESELALSGLAASWETASPGFRLAVLAAELAESLKGYPWAPRNLGAIAGQIREAARGVPGNPRAAELADLAEAAARLRGNGSP